MAEEADPRPSTWNEENSQTFVDLGRYAVPEREWQIAAFCDLIALPDGPFTIAELCCGEGLLAEALLERYSNATVHGYDGSPAMLDLAQARLARFGTRFAARQFDLADHSWRPHAGPAHAVVSSLAIHHLGGAQKQRLFRDVYAMLADGGSFVIADVIAPASAQGAALAASAWDTAVRRRALEFDGNLRGFELFERERWNMYRYPDPTDTIDKPSGIFEQLQWLAQAGFADVDVYWMQAGHALFGGRKIGATQ
jgi:tRNA (cmo5U34)-methyltransferase